MGDLLPVIFFPKPVEIEYISLAYNGVTYFSAALHATRDIFFFFSAGYFFSKLLIWRELG